MAKIANTARDVLHIWPQECVESDGVICAGAMMEKKGQKPFHLWFRVPAKYSDALSKTCDPFVVAAIFPAMREASRLVVHGEVSSSLMRDLGEFQAIWSSWLPESYAEVGISAESEHQTTVQSKRQKAIMAFSGGLDSCFTAYRHTKGSSGRQQRALSAGVMVHGFDIPLKDMSTFALAEAKSRVILDSIGVELIPMATNYRDMGDRWDNVHGAAVASCLEMLQNGYECGLVAASFTYDSLHLNIPWGSNPLSDRLLSTDDFAIVNDGSRFSRIEKLKQISHWPEAMEHMRVCWEGKSLERNCCQCEKCVRGILSCHSLGLDLPKCFDRGVSVEQVISLKVPDLAILFEYQCMLLAARERGIKTRLIRAMEKCISINRKRLTANESLWRKARRIVAVRTRLRGLYGKYAAAPVRNDLEWKKA
jgi:hypothetical protein